MAGGRSDTTVTHSGNVYNYLTVSPTQTTLISQSAERCEVINPRVPPGICRGATHVINSRK